MKGIKFLFDYVHLCYKYRKINSNHVGSCIDSPLWIKNKKATINPINKKDSKRFQYAVTVALNHDKIRKHSGRIKIKTFQKQIYFNIIYFPSEKDDQKKIEKISLTIALNVLYVKK